MTMKSQNTGDLKIIQTFREEGNKVIKKISGIRLLLGFSIAILKFRLENSNIVKISKKFLF